jgi:hypothetical protein
MKTSYIIALAVCIHTLPIQASDDYYRGIIVGTLFTASAALIINGGQSLADAYDINRQTAARRPSANTAQFHKVADHYYLHGINTIALGATCAIIGALGLYTGILTPDPITESSKAL